MSSPRVITEDVAKALAEVQETLRKDNYNRDPPDFKERRWARLTPPYVLGDQVLAYNYDRPATILCADTRYPGLWFIMWNPITPEYQEVLNAYIENVGHDPIKDKGTTASVAYDNLEWNMKIHP